MRTSIVFGVLFSSPIHYHHNTMTQYLQHHHASKSYPGMQDSRKGADQEERYYPPLQDARDDFSSQQASSTSSTTIAHYDDHHHDPLQSTTNIILISVLVVLFILFLAILTYLIVPLAMKRIRARLACSERRVKLRYETIEGWIISKRVREHCHTCERLQERYCSTTTPKKSTKAAAEKCVELSPSYDTAETFLEEDDDDERNNECPVCFECFKQGDIVSWSPRAECDHVFHHSCIKEWLLHHDNCPYCRVTFLSVDQDSSNNSSSSSSEPSSAAAPPKQKAAWTTPQLRELIEDRSQRVRTTYYCWQEGLITLDAAPEADAPRKLKRFLSSGLKPGDLSQLRKTNCGGDGSKQSHRPSSGVAEEGTTTAGASEEVDGDPTNETTTVELATISEVGVYHRHTSRDAAPQQSLHMANSLVDIEQCLQQRRSLPGNNVSAINSTIAAAAPQPLHMANSVVDIEQCLQHRRSPPGSSNE